MPTIYIDSLLFFIAVRIHRFHIPSTYPKWWCKLCGWHNLAAKKLTKWFHHLVKKIFRNSVKRRHLPKKTQNETLNEMIWTKSILHTWKLTKLNANIFNFNIKQKLYNLVNFITNDFQINEKNKSNLRKMTQTNKMKNKWIVL